MSLSEMTSVSDPILAHTDPIDLRTITAVSHMAEGWSVEVEDAAGVRLTYWLADTGCIPHIGDTVTFYGGVAGQPLHGIEINGRRVYYDAAD